MQRKMRYAPLTYPKTNLALETRVEFCPGGYLVERWVWGGVAWIGCLFGVPGLPMTPFYLKIGLDIDCILEKC